MGSLVDTGLGWYLDEDYLLTLGNVTLASVTSGGGPSQYDLPLYTGAYSSFTKDYGLKTYWSSSWTYYTAKHTDVPVLWCYAWDSQKAHGLRAIMSDYLATIYEATYDNGGSFAGRSSITLYSSSQGSGVEAPYFNMEWIYGYRADPNHVIETPYDDAIDILNYVYRNYYAGGGSTTSTLTKPQGGAGAFAIVSYPHDGETVYVGVGISSIGIPNSAATVAVDGVNGSYNTFNREGVQFTMFYTERLTGELTANVPVVALDTDISGLPGVYEPRLFLAVADAARVHVGFVPADGDPYAGGGTSEPGGGTDTDFDITGDTILDSPLPTFSFANSGFARIYNPNLSQLQSLANYLWTDTNFLQTIVNHAKQLLEDPIESIITLNRLPISVPNGTAEVVKVLFIPTNTSMPPVTNQFVDVDCGTLQIKHEYDSALDYNPYTDISLVLPFIGVVQLDPDEVMDKTLSLTYRVDVVSGMCVAKVAVDGCVLYQYSGNCAISMPFNSADFSNYISAMVTAAKSITGVAAAGAAGAMAAAAEGTGAVKAAVSGAVSSGPESTGPSLSNSSNSTNIFKETFGKGGIGEGTLKAAKKGVANTVGAVVSSKRTIEHAGHFSGNSGFLGVRRPYAIIKRPKMCNPDEYGRFNGRPCMMYLYLGNLSGYTEVQEIHLTGILATNDELVEIENLLKSGVIL